EDKYALQEKLERDCLEAASEQFKLAINQFMSVSGTPNMSQIRKLMHEWYPILTNHFKQIIESATNFSNEQSTTQATSKVLYAVYLSSIQAEKIAIIVMQELCRTNAIDSRLNGIPMARIATNIGSCLEREIFAQQIFKNE